MKNTRKTNDRQGFTLAELLIVVAIISVMALIAIPIFNTKLEASKEQTDIANIRSAKAAAVAQYLSGVDLEGSYITSSGITLYFDAVSGTLTEEMPVGYGRGTATDGGCSPYDMVVNHFPGESGNEYTCITDAHGKVIKVFINDVGHIVMNWE